MPLNGSGTYAAPASTWNPATTNTTINSTDWAALLADITTALSTAMYKDGQQTPTANITMGGFKLTNLAAGTLVSDAARVSQVQNGSFTSLTAVAGTNTITATATPTPAAYVVGQVFEGVAAATNTAATTLNISSLGAGAVQVAGAALTGGEIIINGPFRVVVSAVTPVFQLIANGQVAPFLDTNALVKGSADGTKKVRFEVDGLTTGTTRVVTVNDNDSIIGKGPTVQVFTGNGTYTPTTGMRVCQVHVVGGGGGGGGVTTTGAGQVAVGGGGGGGGYSSKLVSAATVGASQTVTIGAGGGGGTSGATGTGGGTTSFGAIVTATGGSGGAGGSFGAAAATAGGAAGAGASGDVNISGMVGAVGWGIGSVPIGITGVGGNSYFGAGGIGQSVGNVTGASGTGFGSGGSGGGNAPGSGAGQGGGAGKDGLVIVYEYF